MLQPIHWESNRTEKSPSHVLVNFDIRGVKYQAPLGDFDKHPDTTLGRLAKHFQRLSGEERKVEYVFDRDPEVFAKVLQFYKTGELHYPSGPCDTIFQRDIHYWEISCPVAPCCTSRFHTEKNNTEVIKSFRETIVYEKELLSNYVFGKKGKRWMPRLWYFLTYPSSCLGARVYATAIYILVLFYTVFMYVEYGSHRILWESFHKNFEKNSSYYDETTIIPKNQTEAPDFTPSLHGARSIEHITTCKEIMKGYFGNFEVFLTLLGFHIVDMIVGIIFALDNFLRLISGPSKRRTLLSFRNIVETICIFPSLAFFIYWNALYILQSCDESSATWIPVLWHLKQLRGLHICVLFMHYMPCRVLIFVIKYNAKQGLIGIFFITVFTFTITMGALVMVSESVASRGAANMESQQFQNAFDAYWYVVITMTTVGYGDISPETGPGKVVGMACALSGILLVAIMVPLMTNNFGIVFHYSRDVDVHPRKDSVEQVKKRSMDYANVGPGEAMELMRKR